mgnify:CR=1 FL=1
MKISYNWLRDYLNLEFSEEYVSSVLTDIGLEVEGIEQVESIKGSLKGVVIGEVLTKIKHPNADRLAITTVNVGSDAPLQIVCGAPNVDIGQKVPVATVGTVLYDQEESFNIKKSKIRGEVSEGMICGADEIGLGNKTDGIMVLDSNAKIGMNASEYFNISSDIVFTIGLTPNRSDAMGHIGVARDLMTALNHKGSKLQMCRPLVDKFKSDNTEKEILVEVRDSKLCPRYSGVSITDVKVGESPIWIQNRLKAIGLTPVNNVVDITNYVLHETGQPLHAFDITKIAGERIIVGTVQDKTNFTTLDGIKRELLSDDLMINDVGKPLCIAGVYGGIDSGVSNETQDIFLESAYFNPISIRKTAKRHILSTDASFRYERGCDPNITVYALKRAALLIKEICGGNISSEIIDIYPEKIEHFEVKLSYENMDSLVGEVIDRNEVKSILSDLEIEVKEESQDSLTLLVPPFRADVTREVDIIEEILRIYGFNTVKFPENLNTIIPDSTSVNYEQVQNNISELLSSNGFNETINNSLTKSSYTALIPDLDVKQDVRILNPLSKDLDVMRQSLLFSGLENIVYNQNRKNTNIKFYEFGKTYHKNNEGYIEKKHLQLLLSGSLSAEIWNKSSDKLDFFFLKEKVEHILYRLGINNFKTSEGRGWGRSYSLTYSYGDQRLVCFGKVTKGLTDKFGIKSDVYMADFNWDLVLEIAGDTEVIFKDVSKFPEVRRDLSLLIDKSVSFKTLENIALKVDKEILKSVNLFDVYVGENLPKGKKSYALSFIMSDDTKTLTDKKIDKVMDKLMESFKNKIGAEVR